MKVITRKEMFKLKGDVVWGYYSEDSFPFDIYIQYNNSVSDGHNRVCKEEFPITCPDYPVGTYFEVLDRFNSTLEGTVSQLETSSDVYSREDEDTLVIIYDEKDINMWIDKLKSLNINY